MVGLTSSSRRAAAVAVALALSALGTAQPAPDFTAVQTLFQERCTLCHSGEAAPLGLRLDAYEGVMAGSVNGPVVVPGDPDASELVRRIEGASLPRMPLTGPPFLDEAQVALVRGWIAAGAPGPDAAGVEPEGGAGPDGPAPAEEAPGGDPGAGVPADDVTFASVEPILLGRCAACHTDGGMMGAPPEGLRLDSYERAIAGGERAVVVPGRPLASELYRRVVGHSLPRMPFGGPYLSEDESDRIAAWIAAGAQDAAGTTAPLPAGREVRLGGVLTARWELDGLPLVVHGGTRLDDDPEVGDYVEVRGVITPDGEVRVERLRVR